MKELLGSSQWLVAKCEGYKLKKELLSKKGTRRDLANTLLIHSVKNEKSHSEENTKGGADQPFDKEIIRV